MKEIVGQPPNTNERMREEQKRARELLGLNKVWAILNSEEELALLRAPSRIEAFRRIDTWTNPREQKIREKKGIVSEIVRNRYILENVLKNLPTIYVGSGTSVEYPLALGARDIRLIDTVLKGEDVRNEVIERIQSLVPQSEIHQKEDDLSFLFDFGEGPERVHVELVPQPYIPVALRASRADGYIMPSKVGLLISYAAPIQFDEDAKKAVVAGGAILQETILSVRRPDGFHSKELSSRD